MKISGHAVAELVLAAIAAGTFASNQWVRYTRVEPEITGAQRDAFVGVLELLVECEGDRDATATEAGEGAGR